MTNKVYKIIGNKGNTTIPLQIRLKTHFQPNEVISLEVKDADTLVIRHESRCHDCDSGKELQKEASLLDVINSLTDTEQKAVFRYLAKKISDQEDF